MGETELPKYTRLNLGCGTKTIEGYINIDSSWISVFQKYPFLIQILSKIGWKNIPSISTNKEQIVRMQFPRGLRKFRDGSADRIYSCHSIEHLTKTEALQLLQECFRIMCSNGLIRIVAPDAQKLVMKYLQETEDALREGKYTSEIRDQLGDVLFGGLIDKKRSAFGLSRHRNAHYFF